MQETSEYLEHTLKLCETGAPVDHRLMTAANEIRNLKIYVRLMRDPELAFALEHDFDRLIQQAEDYAKKARHIAMNKISGDAA